MTSGPTQNPVDSSASAAPVSLPVPSHNRQSLGLQLPQNMPMFVPENRYAVLVNAYDRVTGADANAIAQGYSRGSMRILYMESLLSGRTEPHSALLPLLKIPHLAEFILEEDKKRAKLFREDMPYNLSKLQGYDKDSSVDLDLTIANIAKNATTKSLTFLYLSAHGSEDGIQMIDGLYSYDRMFSNLDKIPGKKVVGILACHSGAALEFLGKRPSADDYIVFASAQANQPSTNWFDDSMDESLFSLLRNRAALSQWKLTASNPEFDGSVIVPQISGNFDVIL